jgi:hypothetical protein
LEREQGIQKRAKMNGTPTTAYGSMARTAEMAPSEKGMSMRDKVDELRFAAVIVLTQLLFRAALLLRRWNY